MPDDTSRRVFLWLQSLQLCVVIDIDFLRPSYYIHKENCKCILESARCLTQQTYLSAYIYENILSIRGVVQIVQLNKPLEFGISNTSFLCGNERAWHFRWLLLSRYFIFYILFYFILYFIFYILFYSYTYNYIPKPKKKKMHITLEMCLMVKC